MCLFYVVPSNTGPSLSTRVKTVSSGASERDPANGQSKSAVCCACSLSLAANTCLHISASSRWVLELTLFFVCVEGASTTALTVCDDFFKIAVSGIQNCKAQKDLMYFQFLTLSLYVTLNFFRLLIYSALGCFCLLGISQALNPLLGIVA